MYIYIRQLMITFLLRLSLSFYGDFNFGQMRSHVDVAI